MGPGGSSERKGLTVAQAHVQFATRERPHQEMMEKSRGRDVFFSAANVKDRPNSVYTEFMESDFEMEHDDEHSHDHDDDDEVYSEFGDLEGIEDGESSPRISIGSVRTPRSNLGVNCSSWHSPDNPALRPSRRTTRSRRQGHCVNGRFPSRMK